MRTLNHLFVLLPFSVFFLPASSFGQANDAATRVAPWTTSRVKGSPEPPLPFKTSQIFSSVQLDRPTNVTWLPDAQKWVANHAGNKIVTFANNPAEAVAKPLLDLSEVYGKRVNTGLAIKFHHDLKNQPWCYVTFTSPPDAPEAHQMARLRVTDASVPTVDPNSLTFMARWKGPGHSGGHMKFGPDGMLYVSVGDGQPPYPPDGDEVGQDRSNLSSAILRIDVDNPTDDAPYRIPADNPFVDQPNARGEIWSFGLRNPWKIAFDPASGDLLAADVGWEMREMIHRVKRGRNHGWSIMEGSQTVKQDQQPEIPITPPLFEHTHLDSRSISGGDFWESDRIPELKGAYLYGDWMTGKVWALKFKGDKVLWQKELVDTPKRVITFMKDPSGELFIVCYDGTILRLEPNDAIASQVPFPSKLSETGIFADVASQIPAEGVVEYDISAHHWADGTHSRQWIGLPDDSQLTLFDKSDWKTGQTEGKFMFPIDTVVAKTVSYHTVAGDPSSERRIETQVLHRYDEEWRAYNYVWNDDQTDALLQDDIAVERELVIRDDSLPEKERKQIWRHASRSECLLCHIWSVGTVQGFWPPQLNIQREGTDQIQHLTELGLFAQEIPQSDPMVSPEDESASLQDRSRAYLAMNCSSCHRRLGGGTANFNFDILNSLELNEYIDALPAQGTFGIKDARVVAPGDPYRSVLIYRALKSGRGHMPQFGSQVIDQKGVTLIHDWIASMEPSSTDAQPNKALSELFGSTGNAKSLSQEQIESMLGSVEGAVALSMACGGNWLAEDTRMKAVELGAKTNHAPIRDLFEHYLPEDQRVKRLGATIDAEALLAIQGSIENGKRLFDSAQDINCRSCHRIGTTGQQIGPDLSGIGTQQTPAEILASIVRPSDKIDAKYRARQVLTIDGDVFVGIITKETPKEISLVDSTGKAHSIAVDDIEQMQTAAKSAMPEQLLTGMTPQNAADLLAYLSSLRGIGPLQHKRAKVKRAPSKIEIDGRRDEAAWQSAESVGDFVFTWWKEGDPPKQQTDAKLLWDDDYLYVSFVCADKDVKATRKGRDSKVYQDDCVEVFASPQLDHPERYFNLEMNALGEQLDQYRPNGEMLEDWNPEGIRIAVSIDGTLNDSSDVDNGWSLEVAIPFRMLDDALPDGRPKVGDTWRLNLSRLEETMASKSQWSQGDRNFPRFHHPEYFGFVKFVD